jgi:integrase/recombinase XerD
MSYYGKDVEEYLAAAVNPQPLRGRTVSPKSLRERDRKIISDYMAERVSLKPGTAKVISTFLVMLCRDLPVPLSEIDTKMMLQYISRINEKLKPNTRRRFFPILKSFLSWIGSEGLNTRLNIDKINSNLKSPTLDLSGRKPSMMLSGEDIKKMIEGAHTSRDRAIIAMMYEGSLRPIEVITATWDNLNFDKFGAQFNTSEKTGKTRYIRLIMSAPYLLQWKNDHPKADPGMPIFVSLKSARIITPLTQSGLKHLIYALGRETLPDKEIFPYLLRHSRITSLIADEVPESIVKKQGWGSVNSRMLATYTHLSDADVDRVMLSRAGITTVETKKDESLKPRQCSHCGTVNTPTAKFCDECGTPLTKEAEKKRDDLVANIEFEGFTPDDIQKAISILKAYQIGKSVNESVKGSV